MRYLKTFESIDKSYEEVSQYSFLSSLYGTEFDHDVDWDTDAEFQFIADNWIDFTQKEFSIIKKIFDYSGLLRASYTDYRDIIQISNISVGGIYIYKLKDEWYYLDFCPILNPREYYKCDQFDGLIQCLNDIKSRI